MREYEVTLPITGKAYLTVLANSEEEAIRIALDEVVLDNIEEWEAVEKINEGNVLYAMQPWTAEAVCVDGSEVEIDEPQDPA